MSPRRRPMGALEDQLMEYLWTLDEPASPGDVQTAIAPELAYTTVMTVLTRLAQKGLLEREQRGRSFVYSPVRTEAEHRAEAMRTSLGRAADRAAVLSSFVHTLGVDDLDTLRHLVAEED